MHWPINYLKLKKQKKTISLSNADSCILDFIQLVYKKRAHLIALFLFLFSGALKADPFDALFEQMRKRFEMAEAQFGHGLQINSGVETVWIDEDKGRKLKIITEGEGENPIEVSIENGQITMSGKIMRTEEVDTGNGVRQSQYVSQFSKSLPVPQDLDADSPKFEQSPDKKTIVVFFPFKDKNKKSKDLESVKGVPGVSI